MSGFRLGRIFGIDVRVHGSWFIIALLVMWTLVTAALPAGFPEVGSGLRLLMASAITLLMFLSLLAHELAHSVVAMARGIPVHRITFFLFGGMAQTSQDSRSPAEEFLIAVAGPAMSFALALAFLGVWWLGAGAGWTPVVVGTAAYLALLNAILGAFNLLPGFPMDGGRILRSVLWKATGDVTRATRWASRIGGWLATALMAYGLWTAFTGDLLGGLWLVLISFFIRSAARSSYQQHVRSRLHDMADRAWQVHLRSRQAEVHRAPPPPGMTGRDVTDLGRRP